VGVGQSSAGVASVGGVHAPAAVVWKQGHLTLCKPYQVSTAPNHPPHPTPPPPHPTPHTPRFYPGTVISYSARSGTHRVLYDDGEEEPRLDMDAEIWVRREWEDGRAAALVAAARRRQRGEGSGGEGSGGEEEGDWREVRQRRQRGGGSGVEQQEQEQQEQERRQVRQRQAQPGTAHLLQREAATKMSAPPSTPTAPPAAPPPPAAAAAAAAGPQPAPGRTHLTSTTSSGGAPPSLQQPQPLAPPPASGSSDGMGLAAALFGSEVADMRSGRGSRGAGSEPGRQHQGPAKQQQQDPTPQQQPAVKQQQQSSTRPQLRVGQQGGPLVVLVDADASTSGRAGLAALKQHVERLGGIVAKRTHPR